MIGFQTAAQLLVKVGADVKNAQKGLKDVDNQVSTFHKGAKLAAVGIGAAFVAIGAAAAMGAKVAIDAGSNLEESINKTKVVFEDTSTQILEWSKTADSALAMTQQQALESASTFGNLFDSMGLTESASASMSTALVQLAADLASFNNIGTEDALMKIKSGIVGEVEPLRALGVNLSAAAVEARALEMGLAASAAELDNNDKVMARYALILEQTKNAQGDLARTSTGWANQTRILGAAVGDLAANVGTKLLPQLLPLLNNLTLFVQESGPAFVQAIADMVQWLITLGDKFTEIGQRADDAGKRIHDRAMEINGSLEGVGVASVSFWEAVGATIDQWIDNMIARFGHMVESLGRGFAVLGESVRLVTEGDFAGALELIKFSFEEDAVAIAKTNEEIISWNDIIAYAIENGLSYGEALVALRDEAEQVANSLVDISDQARGNAEALGQANAAVAETTDALGTLNEEVQFLAEGWSDAWKAITSASQEYGNENQRLIMETFSSTAQEYAQHAVAIVTLTAQKNQALASLDAEYQKVAASIAKSGNEGQLAQLNAANQAKANGIIAYYNGRIQVEQSAQSLLYENAKRALLLTRSMLMNQLRAQLQIVIAQAKALGTGIASGWLNAAAAAKAYFDIIKTRGDVNAIMAAMNDVQAAFDNIEAQAQASAAAALGEFDAWQASAADLADAIDDVGTSLGNIGSGSSGGGAAAAVQTQVIDPLEEAARLIQRIGAMVTSAIEAFDLLTEWGSPDASWVDAFTAFTDAVIVMVEHWAEAAAAITDMGLYEGDTAKNIETFSTVISQVSSAIRSAVQAIDIINGYEETFQEAPGSLRAIAEAANRMVTEFSAIAEDFEQEGLDATIRFSSAAIAVMKVLEAAISAFSDLQRFDSDFNYHAAGLNRLKRSIANVTEWLIQISKDIDEDGVIAAEMFAASAGAVMSIIRDTVKAFSELQEFNFDFSYHLAGLANLKTQIVNMVSWLRRIAEDLDGDATAAALMFADAASGVMAILKDTVDTFTALQSFNFDFNYNEAGLGRLKAQIVNIVDWLVRVAADFNSAGLSAANEFADAALSVIKVISETLKAFEELRKYEQIPEEVMGRFLNDLEYLLNSFLNWLTLVFAPIADSISREMMDTLQGMMRGLREATQTLTALIDYTSPAQTAVDAFISDMAYLFTGFYAWAMGSDGSEGSPAMLLAIPAELISIFNNVMGALGTAVDVLASLVEYVSPTQDAIGAFISDMGRLFTAFYNWAMGDGGSEGSPAMLLEIPPELLATFSSVMRGIGVAVDTLTALVGYQAVGQTAITTFTTDYGLLFTAFHEWATTTFADVSLDTTAAVAAVFGDVMSGLGAAIETLTGIVDYTTPGTVAIEAFETDYQLLMANFATWAETTFTDESATLVGAVGAAASDVFAGLGAAVQTLIGIIGYVGPSDAAISSFEADYQLLMSNFATWAETNFTEESADIVLAVGNAAEALFSGLGLAVTTLQGISTYASPTTTAMDAFIADVTAVIMRFSTFAQTTFTTESLDFLEDFGATTSTLFSGIGTALSTLAAIAGYTVADSDFMMALQRFNQNLLTAITSWALWIVTIMEPSTASLVSEFARILGDITAGFRGALELLMDIDQANLPTTVELAAFIASLEQLFTAVITTFGSVPTSLDNAAMLIMQSLHNIFTNMNPDLWAAGLQTGAHFLGGLRQAFTDIGIITPVLTAMIDLANQLEQVLRDAWGIESPSKVAKGIGKFFVGGLRIGLRDLQSVSDDMRKAMMIDQTSMQISYEPAASRSIVTVSFEGSYQAGMSQSDEARIATAFVNSLRRQGVAIQTR